MSWRLASKASAAFKPTFFKVTMSCSTVAIASLVESPNSVTVSPISLTFLPISAVYFANSSKSALSAFLSIAALLASISWRLASNASAAVKPAFFKVTISSSIRATAVVVASLRLVTSSPMSLTFLPMSAVYFANSSKSALSAFLSIAALLASISWRLASNAPAAAKPTFFKVLISSSKLAIALLKPSLASFCSSSAALLAFTSALMSLTTAAVFTSASLFSVTALFKPSSVSSCAATTSFKPMPSKSAFSTSSFVAVRMTFEPSSLVTTIWSPSWKPLSSWAFSIAANVACAAALWVSFTASFKPRPLNSSALTSSSVAVLTDLTPLSSVTMISSFSLKPLSSWAFSIAANAACSAAFLARSVSAVKSAKLWSCCATTSFKPSPPNSSCSTSSLVAFLTDLTPSASVTTISSPSLKPSICWAFSAMDKAARSANSSTALFALSAFSATASILEAASTALAAASLASFTLLSILAESAVTLSSAALAASLASVTLLSTLAESAVTLSSAALAAALASAVSCARLSTRVFTAVTSSLTFSMDSESSDEALEISLSTSSNLEEMSSPILVTDLFRSFTPVATSAIRVPLVVMAVFSSSMVSSWSSKAADVSSANLSTRALTAVRPPAKPTPFRLSASISSLVALRTVFLPLASVVMKFEPDAKPLMVCSNSKVFKSRASLSFLKVSLPVSLSNVVPSPKTVKNAAFPWFFSVTACAKFTSSAAAAPLTTAAATARLNAFTLNFFMFFTFLWWV